MDPGRENSILFEKNKRLAIRDELTDLYNRRYCWQYLESEIGRCKRYGHPFSVVMFDIDHFKRINDSLGHGAGDEILKTVAVILTSCSRETDVVGRYGGEEFLAILPETSAEGARAYSERVCLTVEEFGREKRMGFTTSNETISAGVT